MIELHFDNWCLTQRANTPPAYQYDNDTIPIIVTGNIPDGWDWNLLLAHGEYLDVAHMDATDDGLVVVLTAEQLAFDGYYTAQLRASQGDKVKHSSPVLFAVGDSLSGDEQWPEIPTAFTQAVERAEAAITTAEGVEQTVTQARDDAVSAAQDAADSKAAAAGSASEAAGSAEDAEDAAQSAEAAVERYPRISTTTGNWERWQDGEWADTGVHAEGPQGETGATGPQGETGPQGPQGPQGEPGEVSEAELNAGLATKADKTSLSATDKRLNYLYELTQGQAWDTETGTTPAYQQTAPAGAKAAEIGSIGGKTVVWNQKANELNDFLPNNCTKSYDSETNQLTCTPTNYESNAVGFYAINKTTTVVGHSYLVKIRIMLEKAANVSLGIGGITKVIDVQTTSYSDVVAIINDVTSTLSCSCYVRCAAAGWTNEKYYINGARLIDLTQLFGAGNEPTTTDDPRIAAIIAYAKEHPEYDAGSLLSGKVTEVESVGFNLWDEDWEIGSIHPDTGENASATDRIRSKNYIPVKPSTNYYFKKMTASGSFRVFYYDIRKNFVSYYGAYTTNRVFTTPDNCYYIRFWDASAADYGDDICVNLSQPNTSITPHDGQYLPNMKDSVEIPAALRTFLADKGYGWSAGTAYNELNLEAKKYIQRVGSVDLGTLTNYAWNGTYEAWNSTMPSDAKIYSESTLPYNGTCAEYLMSNEERYAPDKTISPRNNGTSNIFIKDSSTLGMTMEELKEYFSGVTLLYELATPIEYDTSSYLPTDNLLTVEAGGTVTFVQEGGTQLEVPNDTNYLIKLTEAI